MDKHAREKVWQIMGSKDAIILYYCLVAGNIRPLRISSGGSSHVLETLHWISIHGQRTQQTMLLMMILRTVIFKSWIWKLDGVLVMILIACCCNDDNEKVSLEGIIGGHILNS